MKIAICFSGSIRDFSTCYPSIKRYVLDNLNADIFLHLWKMDDVSNLDANVNFKWKNDSCDEKYVIEQLNPKAYVVDKYSNLWEEKIVKESRIDVTKLTDDKLKNYGINSCGMYYKIYQAFLLMENYCHTNNVKYDIIIRARLDFIWRDHILPHMFSNAKDDQIFLVKDRYATHSGLETNDKFFAGTFNVMKKMCNIFNHIHIYQKMGLLVEGQTLNEKHIKMNKFKVRWLGNKYTYYKCMGKHAIHNNNKLIVINNSDNLSKFWFELAYFLIYQNYPVVYLVPCHDKYIDILSKFTNFKFYDENNSLGDAYYYIGQTYHSKINSRQIIINGLNIQHKNTITINVSPDIGEDHLLDFVCSIINTNRKDGYFHFTKTLKIPIIEINEKVIFRYLDHGYFLATVTEYDSEKNTYTINFNNKVLTNETRDNIKIIDLIKYYQKMDPKCMPTN